MVLLVQAMVLLVQATVLLVQAMLLALARYGKVLSSSTPSGLKGMPFYRHVLRQLERYHQAQGTVNHIIYIFIITFITYIMYAFSGCNIQHGCLFSLPSYSYVYALAVSVYWFDLSRYPPNFKTSNCDS